MVSLARLAEQDEDDGEQLHERRRRTRTRPRRSAQLRRLRDPLSATALETGCGGMRTIESPQESARLVAPADVVALVADTAQQREIRTQPLPVRSAEPTLQEPLELLIALRA